jgi:hypothetical protein
MRRYEPAALKRLMGRYATRESEIDRMLRAGLELLGCAARHGIPVQPEPLECGNLSRKSNLRLGWLARGF